MKHRLAAFLFAALAGVGSLPAAPLYSLVTGLDRFEGSAAGWQLLQSNGFVVADSTCSHMYEPYVESTLPVFITVDSAWHAYHELLQYGVAEAETARAPKLAAFSRALESRAREVAQSEGADFTLLASYAGLALALQDDDFAAKLPEAKKKIVEDLRAGSGAVETGLGFPLEAGAFKPTATGAVSPDDAGYFAARQWYGAVVFRLSDARETRLALSLAWLIEQDAGLSNAWRALNDFDEVWQGPASDGAVTTYAAAMAAAGAAGPGDFETRLDSIRQALGKVLPAPSGNDPALTGEDAHLSEASRGFRLLPPRHRPSWMGATPTREGYRAAVAAPLPASIMGRALGCLAGVTEPLPEAAAPALRTAAWGDLQLWTQLGGWAEWLARRATAPKLKEPPVQEGSAPPGGMAAPYPKCFAALAANAREAATVLAAAGAEGAPNRLRDFAAVCDRLTGLAQKARDGTPLSGTDTRWIRHYGATLQSFLPGENEADSEEFPMVSRAPDGLAGAAPYAWVAQPQALYIILPAAGHWQLHTGAVLSFRAGDHGAGTNGAAADAPPAPDFTRSFRAQKTVLDLLAALRLGYGGDAAGDPQATAQQLESRLTDADLPDLLRELAGSDTSAPYQLSPTTGLIAKLNWKPFQADLLRMMETNEATVPSVAFILNHEPETLDAAAMCANFDRQPPLVRSLYCRLLRKHGKAPGVEEVFCRATRDPDEDVRWSAIVGLREWRVTTPEAVAALTARLTETNDVVAGAAARALGKLGVTSAAPLLLTNLQTRLAAPESAPPEAPAPFDLTRRFLLTGESPDDLEQHSQMRRRARPVGDFVARPPGVTPVDEFVLALGALHYQPATETISTLLHGPHDAAAAKALDSLAPESLRAQLLDTACDTKQKPEERDHALQLLMQTSPSAAGARRLAPMLDDTNMVQMDLARGPISQKVMWRLSERAGLAIGHLLDKPPGRLQPTLVRPMDSPEEQARQWLHDGTSK